jgi:hypothetical protein
MKHKQKISGGIIAFIGYILSPLSWWNDLFVNIPLAYAGAWLVSLVYRPAFLTSFVISYWITNIAGLIMMHKGIVKVARKAGQKGVYSKKDLLKDVAWSLFYTALIVALVEFRVIKPIGAYIKDS